MNLGELIVELSADSSELEKTLERAKKKAYEAAKAVEKSFADIELKIGVDDDSLTDLNEHLNLKVKHLKEVNKYFNNNPIVVNVDDKELTDLNKHLNLKVQHLKEVNKYFDSNPIVVSVDDSQLTELSNNLDNLHQKKVVVSVGVNNSNSSFVNTSSFGSNKDAAMINHLKSINSSINSINSSINSIHASIIIGDNLIVKAINNLGTTSNTTFSNVSSGNTSNNTKTVVNVYSNDADIFNELKSISSKLDFINSSTNTANNSINNTSVTGNAILQTIRSSVNGVNSSIKALSGIANAINSSVKLVNKAINTQTQQSSSGFFNGIFTNPIAVLGKAVNNIFVGFTEEIGRELSIQTVRPFNRAVIKKIKHWFKVFDDEIIGKEQVYETFLAEFINTGSIEKSNYAAGKRTKIQKHLNRLDDLQVIANFEEEFKSNKNIPNTVTAIDNILSQEPELDKQFKAYAAKPSELSLVQKKARFIPTILNNAQPTDLSNKVILPLIKEFQPLLKFIQGMQSHHTSKLAEAYYLERKPAFPVLEPGQKVVSVIGGAEHKLGQGGRATATSLEPIFGPNIKLLPVENLDTDETERTKELDNWIIKQIKQFAPNMLQSIPTIKNAIRQIAYAFHPKGSDVGAAQAIAHARLAKEQGNEASAISFSLGGATAYRYAKTAEYQGIKTKALAMAYPYTNLLNATPEGFHAAILEKDPLTFPYKLDAYNPTKAINILEDAGIKSSSADVHAIHHLFRSPNFVRKLNTVVGGNLPTDKDSLKKMSDIQRMVSQLHPTLVSIVRAKDIGPRGGYNMGLIEHLTDSKYNLDKLQESQMPNHVQQMAQSIRTQAMEALDSLVINVEKFEFPTGKYKDLPSDDSHKGYQKYKQEVDIINKSIESFKSRTVLPGAYFAGGLNREKLIQVNEELSQKTIPWFKESQQQQKFGEYGREIIKGFEKVIKLQLEFIRTHGNISDKFLDQFDSLPITGLTTEVMEQVKFPDNVKEPGIMKYINEVHGINASLKSFKTNTKSSDAWWAGNLDITDITTRKRDLAIQTIPWFEKQKQFGEYGKKIVDGFKTIIELQEEFIRTNGKISQDFLDKINYLPIIPNTEALPRHEHAINQSPEFHKLPEYFEERVRLDSLPISDAMKAQPATVLAYNHIFKSIGAMMPSAKDIKAIEFGWPGATGLISDKLVYKTDLNELGKKKIASEQEVKAYERLQGRYAPLLYAAKPGESMIVERLVGRDLKRIMEEYAVPIRVAKEQQAKKREELKPKITELEILLENENNPEEREKIQKNLKDIKDDNEKEERKIRESIKQFNDIFQQFYYHVGQLGAAIQKMGVVHNDLASSNVFFKDFKIDPKTNKVDIGEISSIDLSMSAVLPNKKQKFDDKVTTISRALMDISLHGILDPILIASAINSGYKKPLELPPKRSIDESLLRPQNPGQEIPIGYTGKTLLQRIGGDIQEYKARKPSTIWTPDSRDIKEINFDPWESVPSPVIPDDFWLDPNIGSTKNLNVVSDLVDSTDSILNQAAIKLENAAMLLMNAVNSLNNLVINLKVSSLNIPKTRFQSIASKQKKVSSTLEFGAIPSTMPEPVEKQLEAIRLGLIKGVDLSQRYKDATQAENKAPVPDSAQSLVIEEIQRESQISLDEIKKALDTINKYFSAEYQDLAAELKASQKSGNLDTIKATKTKLRDFVNRSREAIATIDEYVEIGKKAGFQTGFNDELTAIKRTGKQGMRKREELANNKIGGLNRVEVDIYNAKWKEQLALAEQHGINIGRNIDDGLKQGIQHNANGVSDEARQMLNNLIALIKSELGIESPSKVMFDVGRDIIAGLSLGIVNNLNTLKTAAEKLASTVINTVEKGFEIHSPSLWGIRTGTNVGNAIGNSAVRALFMANISIVKMLNTIRKHEKDITPLVIGDQIRMVETRLSNQLSTVKRREIVLFAASTDDLLDSIVNSQDVTDPQEQINKLTANLYKAKNILIQKISDSVLATTIRASNQIYNVSTQRLGVQQSLVTSPVMPRRLLPSSRDYRYWDNNYATNRLEVQQQELTGLPQQQPMLPGFSPIGLLPSLTVENARRNAEVLRRRNARRNATNRIQNNRDQLDLTPASGIPSNNSPQASQFRRAQAILKSLLSGDREQI